MEKYFKFDGSATRSEYWAVNIVGGICTFILALFGAIFAFGEMGVFATVIGGAVLAVTLIGAFWLSIATAVRRCKDAGLNPWWTLALIIPYVGTIVFIVFGCLKTDATAQ